MKTIFSVLITIALCKHVLAQNDSIFQIELNKPFAVAENQKYKLKGENVYLKIKDIVTEKDMKPAQLKRPHAKVKVTLDLIKGAKKLDSYLWDWDDNTNRDNFPLAWDKYSLSLTVKDSIYITLSNTVFEKPFFIKTGEIAFIQNLEIRYNEFRFDYDPAYEGKGYMKKMKFYVTQGREGKQLEITIIDKPIEIEWFAYKLRFIKDIQEFAKIEVIRNE